MTLTRRWSMPSSETFSIPPIRELIWRYATGVIVDPFARNSGGIGQKYGFEIEEILLVCHGGWHNDTICVVDRKSEFEQMTI